MTSRISGHFPEFRDFKDKFSDPCNGFQSLKAKMILIALDLLCKKQLVIVVMLPGFPVTSRTSVTFWISGAY